MPKKKDYYHHCLVEYKKYLRNRYKKHNKKREQLKKEIDNVMKVEDEVFNYNNFGGGVKTKIRNIQLKHDPRKIYDPTKRKGKKLKKCVFDYSKALEKEEKELKERLKLIKIERISLKRNLKQVIDDTK